MTTARILGKICCVTVAAISGAAAGAGAALKMTNPDADPATKFQNMMIGVATGAVFFGGAATYCASQGNGPNLANGQLGAPFLHQAAPADLEQGRGPQLGR